MKKSILLLTLLMILPTIGLAETSVIIDLPANASSYTQGTSFTLTATVSCGETGTHCQDVTMTATFGSELSTASTNPQSCGQISKGDRCEKSWTVDADSAGNPSITVIVNSSNYPSAYDSIGVTIIAAPVCGNNAKEGSEICDGTDLAGQDCTDHGFVGGTLACAGTCDTFVTSSCTNCGNSIVDAGEDCDGTDMGSGSCTSEGFDSGTLSCTIDCGYDTSNCQSALSDIRTEGGGGSSKQTLKIKVISPMEEKIYKNGDHIILFAEVKTTNIISEGINVSASLDEKEIILNYNKETETYDGIIQIINQNNLSTIIINAEGEKYFAGSASFLIEVNSKLKTRFNLKDEYIKGSSINISGKVLDYSSRGIKSNVNIIGDVNRVKMFDKKIETDENGGFTYNYPIGFLDIDGKWTITAILTDEFGNTGKYNTTIDVLPLQTAEYYDVKFLSPAANFVYKRGEKVNIQIQITKGKEKVSGADFKLRAPDGGIIDLIEINDGIYSIDYQLPFDTPEGELPIYVIGSKGEGEELSLGTGSLPVNIQKTELFLQLISPTKTDFNMGETLNIKVRVAYQDNSIPTSLYLTMNSPSGEEIILKKQDEYFVASYLVEEKDEGKWRIELKAEDPWGNAGSKAVVASVVPFSIYSLLSYYWWIVVIVLIPVAGIAGAGFKKGYKDYRLKSLEREKKNLSELKKDVQEKYYRQDLISKDNYLKLMEKYEERESNIKGELSDLKRNIKKQKKKYSKN